MLAAAELLRDGQIVGIPTETVYGLAANALSASAVAAVFAAKERPAYDPLIVHVATPTEDGSASDALDHLCASGFVERLELSSTNRRLASKLMRAFWPGPLTLVLPKGPRILDEVTAGLSSAAFRMPSHPVSMALLRLCGLPLAAPSANRFGRISPTTAAHVLAELGRRIPMIIDGGPCLHGLESTVLRLSSDAMVEIVRPGVIGWAQIEAVVGEQRLTRHREPSFSGPQIAPGMLPQHYAPQTPLGLLQTPLEIDRVSLLVQQCISKIPRSIAIVTCQSIPGEARHALSLVLGCSLHFQQWAAEPSEVAHSLYATLRDLDDGSHDLILVELSSDQAGLGIAINDRLGRAAHRRELPEEHEQR